MRYVRLGWSGALVSQLALGTWHLPPSKELDQYGIPKVDEELSLKIMKRAYDLGINLIDTANRYHGVQQPVDVYHVGNSERIVGRFLQTIDRESVVLATKVRGQMAPWPNGEGLSRKHIMWQVRESLRRLNTDHIDLYQIHWPDPNTSRRETLRALNDLISMGLVNYIGSSNHPAHDVAEFMELAERMNLDGFVSLQERYNLLERGIESDGRLEVAKRYRLAILAYSPQAQGVLTGKYYDFQARRWVVPEGSRASYVGELAKRFFNDQVARALEAVKQVADSKGITMAQLAIAWLIRRGEQEGVPIVPIVGATRVEHVEEAVGALDVKLNDDDMKFLDEATKGVKVI